MLEFLDRYLNKESVGMKNSNSTILIAEDNEDSRAMLRTFLELKGYRVLEARDGEEAVEIARFAQPDLIIIDLNMPKLGGIAASEQIRQFDKLSQVPILTNSASGKYGMELFLNVGKLGGGYLEYIPKPFNFEYLSELIETILLKTKKAI
jgi:CheY-like chemotaxis protein